MSIKHFPSCHMTHCRFYDPDLTIWMDSSREAWHTVKSITNCIMCKHFIRPSLIMPRQPEIVDEYANELPIDL
jgi:hypothetical protein